jgi:hypothetical protein
VGAGTEQTVRVGADEFHVAYSTEGTLIVRGVQGNFVLTPSFLQGFAVEVPEGGGLKLHLNRPRHLFTAQAAPESAANLRVLWSGKTYMFLSGDARVTIVLGQNSLIPEASPAWIFFEGAGGDSIFASSPQPGMVITPDRIDISRIQQEPVSVIE